jgi:hypothetical protein
MLRKSLIITLGFLGLFLAGTASGSTPASAGYACGPWNAWCGRAWLYPGWGHGYGKHHWRRSYNDNHWNRDWHGSKGKHAHKNRNWRNYD